MSNETTMRAALERIAHGLTQVHDEDLGETVWAPMDADECADIARAALVPYNPLPVELARRLGVSVQAAMNIEEAAQKCEARIARGAALGDTPEGGA